MALSVWLAVGMVFFILTLGIGIDFSGQVAAQQDARNVAAQAARVGGQQVAFEDGGQRPKPDIAKGVTAARAFLASSEYTGIVRIEGTQIVVAVEGTYRTVFLSVIGIDTLPVRANATADTIRAVDGQER